MEPPTERAASPHRRRREDGRRSAGCSLDGGLRGTTSDEVTRRRKRSGMCPTCGEVKTHKSGLWKSKMPLTVSGLVYKGICLVCNTLDSAKLQRCEPIDGPVDPLADMDRDFQAMKRPSIFIHAGSSLPPALALPNPQEASPASADLRSLPEIPRAREPPLAGSRSASEFCTGTVDTSNSSLQGRGEMAQDDADVVEGAAAKGGLEEESRPLHGTHRPRPLPGFSVGDRARREDMRTTSQEETVAAVAKLRSLPELRPTKSLPQGRGKMAYDDVDISRPLHEAHRPRPPPGASVGDRARGAPRGGTAAAVARLRVGDCAWIRRSDGTWSYSALKSRSRPGGDDESVTFAISARGSTKTVPRGRWAGHLRVPATPDVLGHYSAGDRGLEADMIVASRKDAARSMSDIRIGDGAFVMRSDRSWAYAIVKDRTHGEDGEETTITFRVNERGATKVLRLSQCGKFARRVKHNEEAGFCEEKANSV